MLSKSDYKFFEKAKTTSLLSEYKGANVGAVVVYKGNIISVGFNSYKTHTIMDRYNRYRGNIRNDPKYQPTLHAEISALNAIRHSDIDFSKVKLYIYRSKHDGTFGLAAPCPACRKMIKDMGIKHIYYTGDDSFIYERLFV